MFSALFEVKQGHCSLLKLTIHNCVLKAGFHWRRSRSRNRSRSHNKAYDVVKIENRIRKQSHELDGIGVGRIRTFLFLQIPFTTLPLMIQ